MAWRVEGVRCCAAAGAAALDLQGVSHLRLLGAAAAWLGMSMTTLLSTSATPGASCMHEAAQTQSSAVRPGSSGLHMQLRRALRRAACCAEECRTAACMVSWKCQREARVAACLLLLGGSHCFVWRSASLQQQGLLHGRQQQLGGSPARQHLLGWPAAFRLLCCWQCRDLLSEGLRWLAGLQLCSSWPCKAAHGACTGRCCAQGWLLPAALHLCRAWLRWSPVEQHAALGLPLHSKT